ncbi:MAG: hypothetical protein HYZ27_01665 [Deltaproteobacteria bacterium]|nr:hypothetical protein [Deltaproteobacteria bacterium]
MADRPDKDQLVRTPKPPAAPKAPAQGGLPVDEPSRRPPQEERAELARRIAEIEGSLQYMGAAHPQRAKMQEHLAKLRAMLGRT